MEIAVIFAGLFAYFLFLTLFDPLLEDSRQVDRRIKKLKESAKDLNEELNKPITERLFLPAYSKMRQGLSKLSSKKDTGSLSKLGRDLRMAGIYMPPGEFSALKVVILFLSLFVSLGVMLIMPGTLLLKPLVLLFGLILGILIPRYYLQSKIKGRQNEIRAQMPDVMDLLSVSVEAGLSFDAALLRVGGHAKGALIDELLVVYREIQMGKPRKDALKSLSERSSVEEIKTFSGAMIQAEQLGISIKNVLRVQAQQLRLKRRQIAEEKGMKAPVKMMLPLVAFIFPVIFIILLGPSAVKIFNVFGG